MEDVELFDQELNAGCDQVVGHVVAVDLDQGRHNQQVSTRVKNVPELMGGIDDCGHAISAENEVIIFFSKIAKCATLSG